MFDTASKPRGERSSVLLTKLPAALLTRPVSGPLSSQIRPTYGIGEYRIAANQVMPAHQITDRSWCMPRRQKHLDRYAAQHNSLAIRKWSGVKFQFKFAPGVN